jgi:hypothetical protein
MQRPININTAMPNDDKTAVNSCVVATGVFSQYLESLPNGFNKGLVHGLIHGWLRVGV